jgi:hypothetical protein
VTSAAFSPDGTRVAVGTTHNSILSRDLSSSGIAVRSDGHANRITGLAVRSDRKLISASQDATTRSWDGSTGEEVCRLVTFGDGLWVAYRPSTGQFDTSDVEKATGLSLVASDQPFRPLPIDVFMRDYFEPRLLARLLAGDPVPKPRPLADLNRVQPTIESLAVRAGRSASEVLVEVTVARNSDTFSRGGRSFTKMTDPFDVRLFRDGQLVGRWPEPTGNEVTAEPDPISKEQMDAWHDSNHIALGPDGRATRSFTVRLPHRTAPGVVEFTAYAFNVDRVKSTTASAKYDAPANPPASRPRAYLICMGVAANQSRRWDLAFPAADARRIKEVLGGV